jgi:hypothetical protein
VERGISTHEAVVEVVRAERVKECVDARDEDINSAKEREEAAGRGSRGRREGLE